jgi:hypothetical protein
MIAFAQHAFNVLRFSLVVENWIFFCALKVSRFIEAKTHMVMTLAINALRDFIFYVAQILFCNEV